MEFVHSCPCLILKGLPSFSDDRVFDLKLRLKVMIVISLFLCYWSIVVARLWNHYLAQNWCEVYHKMKLCKVQGRKLTVSDSQSTIGVHFYKPFVDSVHVYQYMYEQHLQIVIDAIISTTFMII